MSQTNADATDRGTDSNSNDDSDALAEQVTAMRERLDALDDGDLQAMGDLELVELRTELKELEDKVENVRKSQADAVLETRVEPGEKLFGLHRVESHSKFVDEAPGAVIARAAKQGINWSEFVELKPSKLADVAPELAEVGRYEYTYFR